MHAFRQLLFLASVAVVASTAHLSAQQQQQPISSANTTVNAGQPFTPPFHGGSGTGNWQFAIQFYTQMAPGVGQPAGTRLLNGTWASSWTPTDDVESPIAFYVARNGDANYATTAWAVYSLTINGAKAKQAAIGAVQNASANVGQPFTPVYTGGSGTGGWQFLIPGFTNWAPGAGHPAGTDTGSAPQTGDLNNPALWSPSWTPPSGLGGSSVTYYIARNGDAGYTTSYYGSGPYNLNIAGPTDGITFGSTSGVPNGQFGNSPASFSVSVTNSGQTTWTNNYVLALYDSNGTNVANASLVGVGPGGQKTVTLNFTLETVPVLETVNYTLQAVDEGVRLFGPVFAVPITIQGTRPIATQPPPTQSADYGSTTLISFTYTGTAIAFQWQVSTNGGTTWTNLNTGSGMYGTYQAPYAGVFQENLIISSVPASINGYQYRCEVTEAGVTIPTSATTLTVTGIPPPPPPPPPPTTGIPTMPPWALAALIGFVFLAVWKGLR